jgi:hypothetical protein
MPDWPSWWDWEIDTTLPHLRKRMVDRGFSETDLLLMLTDATGYHRDHEPGPDVVETRHGGRAWEVIDEPLDLDEILVVVTAYPID